MPRAVVAILLLAILPFFPGQAGAAGPEVFLPGAAELEPLRMEGVIDHYTADNLWERIDGEAELYRRFGLGGAAVALYAHPGDQDRRVELSVFTLRSPLDAFGLFATFRAPGDRVEQLGNGAVREEYQGFLWQGTVFVLADALGPDATREADLGRALEAVARRLGPPPPLPPLLAAFMKVAEPDGMRVLPDHLLGREALPPGLEGTGPGGVAVFVASARVDWEAVQAAYRESLAHPASLSLPGMTALTGEDRALGPVTLAARGGFLAGVRAGRDLPGVGELLERLLGVAATLPP